MHLKTDNSLERGGFATLKLVGIEPLQLSEWKISD